MKNHILSLNENLSKIYRPIWHPQQRLRLNVVPLPYVWRPILACLTLIHIILRTIINKYWIEYWTNIFIIYNIRLVHIYFFTSKHYSSCFLPVFILAITSVEWHSSKGNVVKKYPWSIFLFYTDVNFTDIRVIFLMILNLAKALQK